MRKTRKSIKSISKYLPILIILLSITIMVGSTFAYFTDRKEDTSNLTFSKVELSSETTLGVNGAIHDVIPGSKLIDGEVAFSKAIDSEAIYVRAKVSFSLPSEYKNDTDMQGLLDKLRSATNFNIESGEQAGGAVWSEKMGNYFYLVTKDDATKLMRVDTIDTYVLSSDMVVPRDLEQLDGNAQYMKSINFHIAFEAIQADNVSDNLADTKEVFDTIFTMSSEEVSSIYVSIMNSDLTSVKEKIELTSVSKIVEPEMEDIVDENGTTTHIFDGWYLDSTFTTEFNFDTEVTENISLYPKYLQVSEGLVYTAIYGTSTSAVNTSEFSQSSEGEQVIIGYSVAKGTCSDIEIILPLDYMGKPITMIANNAFKDMTTLINIRLPQTVTNIGYYAFYGCVNLELKNLPSELVSIGNYAFQKCEKLNLTTLPSGVYSIGQYVFTGCTSLPYNNYVYYLRYENSNDYYVIKALDNTITTVEWPGNVIAIATSAFQDCVNLSIISIPDSVESIGSYAFSDCKNLVLSVLPSELKSIGSQAFYGCVNLTLTGLPNKLLTIDDYAFGNCTNLALNKLPDGLKNIGVGAFQNCSNIELSTLPSGLTSINTRAFLNCTGLKLKELPSSVESIGVYAFQNCSNIELTSLPSGLLSIGNYAFQNCTGLTLTELPSGIISIGSYAFNGCTNLALTELPSGTTSIGEYAFYGCTSLALTELLSGITSIGEYAFYGCTSLKSITISSEMETIGNSAFYNCTSLTEINFNATAMSNFKGNSYVFGNAGQSETGITVNIGANVTKIPAYLFYMNNTSYSPKVIKIIFEDESVCKSVGSYAFYNCTSLKLVELPSGLTGIGTYAFNDCTSLNYILCETDAVATLASGKGRANTCIYSKQESGYSGLTETEVVINDTLTIYTATDADGYKWVRTSDNKYYKCIV